MCGCNCHCQHRCHKKKTCKQGTCEYTKKCDCKKFKCTKTCRQLCKPRNIPEPTGITTINVPTSGNITGQVPGAPLVPANLSVLTKSNPANPLAICVHGYPSAATE